MKKVETYFKLRRFEHIAEAIDSANDYGCLIFKKRYNTICVNTKLIWDATKRYSRFKAQFIQTYIHELIHHLIEFYTKRMKDAWKDKEEEDILEDMGY